MSFPRVERELYCENCKTFFGAEGRWVRCSFDDPYDVDFEPEPRCPECGSRDAIDAEDMTDQELWERSLLVPDEKDEPGEEI